MNALLALVMTLVLHASAPTRPVLRSACCGGNYLAINPLNDDVEMTISCVGDYAQVLLRVSAGTQQELEIRQPDGYAATCLMESYRKVR